MMAGLLSLPVWVRVVASVLIGIGVFVAGTVLWATRSQEAAAIAQARVSASTITQVTVAGMKAVMLTGDAAQQTGFVEHLRRSQGIEALRVVPAESVRRQFGAKTAGDARADAVEAGVLGDAQPYTAVERLDGKLTYRAVVPVLVQGKACLGCHQVDEGAVLGAVSLRIGLDEVDRSSRTFRHGVLLAALAGALPVVLVSYLLVSRTVSRPLLEVVRQLREIAASSPRRSTPSWTRSTGCSGTCGTRPCRSRPPRASCPPPPGTSRAGPSSTRPPSRRRRPR